MESCVTNASGTEWMLEDSECFVFQNRAVRIDPQRRVKSKTESRGFESVNSTLHIVELYMKKKKRKAVLPRRAEQS